MDLEILINRLTDLREKAKAYHEANEFQVLEKCPFIVEVGALTVTTDESGKTFLHNALYPTQFSAEGINEILGISFKNGNGEVVLPKVYSRREWYKERLQDLTDTIRAFETLVVV